MAIERRRLALVLLALAACTEPTLPAAGPAYDPSLPSGDIYRWRLGSAVRVFVDTTDVPAGVDLRASTRFAIAGWQRALYYRDVRLSLTDSLANADVIVRASQAPRLVGTAACTPSDDGASGATFFCRAGIASSPDTALTLPLLAGGAGHVKVEIAVDPTGVVPPVVLVAHELGHALGIGAHSTDPSDLMYAAPTASGPSARDARTLRWLMRVVPDLRL